MEAERIEEALAAVEKHDYLSYDRWVPEVLAAALREAQADIERLREALTDALVVFADTKWAESYRHLVVSSPADEAKP